MAPNARNHAVRHALSHGDGIGACCSALLRLLATFAGLDGEPRLPMRFPRGIAPTSGERQTAPMLNNRTKSGGLSNSLRG